MSKKWVKCRKPEEWICDKCSRCGGGCSTCEPRTMYHRGNTAYCEACFLEGAPERTTQEEREAHKESEDRVKRKLKPLKEQREDCFKHTQQRARERYGITLTREDWEILAFDGIDESREAKLVNTHERGQVTFKTLLHGQEVYGVFSLGRSCVTTLLPPEHFA